MGKRIHLYVLPRSIPVWISAFFLITSILARLHNANINSAVDFWMFILLPTVAAALYTSIILLNGKECFYKTSISVWMMSFYCGSWIMQNVSSRVLIVLSWIALLFLALLYTEIVSGIRQKWIWLLNPMILTVAGMILYIYQPTLQIIGLEKITHVIPDLLFLSGLWFLTFGIHIHSDDEYHQTWGDRSDGRRIRTLSPMDQVSPYIMVERNNATNFFEESFEISMVDRYIRQKRREGLTNFGIMHVLLACYCRAVARYPGVNRFISGQKVYTHGEDIQFCLTIKKEMSISSPETIIKVHLSPRDTAYDVYRKVNEQIEAAKDAPLDSSFDHTAHVLMLIPGVILKFIVWLLKLLDYFGLLPAFLLEISPFHGSIFLTSMGSLGIPPIFHHLYNFGNLPVFGAFGCKRKTLEILEDGTIIQNKYVDFKFSLDERIVDGYYYAAFFKHYKRIIAHPEILDHPPEEIITDID